jgi:uncharacterized repeat protein (TIGR01451 family)
MRRIIPTALFLALVLLVQAGATGAGQEGIIELKATAEIEVEIINQDGEKEVSRVEAAKVVPGDEVIYTIYYANVGDGSAEQVVITDAIPDHMFYTEGSASGEGTAITFSVDEGQTYDVAENLEVAQADGTRRPAKASDYTHIRWSLERPLAPIETGRVAFRAKLQ